MTQRQVLSLPAREGGSYIVGCSFFQKTSDGVTKTPIAPNDDLSWTLCDASGNIINGREGVYIAPNHSITIILRPDDLRLSGIYPELRILTITGTYNSLLGDNLEILDECEFTVINSVKIPPQAP